MLRFNQANTIQSLPQQGNKIPQRWLYQLTVLVGRDTDINVPETNTDNEETHLCAFTDAQWARRNACFRLQETAGHLHALACKEENVNEFLCLACVVSSPMCGYMLVYNDETDCMCSPSQWCVTYTPTTPFQTSRSGSNSPEEKTRLRVQLSSGTTY